MAKKSKKPTDLNKLAHAIVEDATADEGVGPRLGTPTLMPTPKAHPPHAFVPASERVR